MTLRLPLALLLFLLLLPGVAAAGQSDEGGAASGGRTQVAPPGTEVASRPRIAFMPLETPLAVAPAAVHCPICGVGLSRGEIASGGGERLTEAVARWLAVNRCFNVLPTSVAEGAYQRLLRETMTATTVAYMQGVGRLLEADAVLGGIVYRYTERMGTAYSISHAASLGFDLHLVRTTDGAILWTGHFDETQKDLSQNLFNISRFFKRGVRWLTIDEFAVQAVAETLKSFPASILVPEKK
ncbi:MAG: hypothetical protein V2A77_07645 [Pseudomonadota bacterium]